MPSIVSLYILLFLYRTNEMTLVSFLTMSLLINFPYKKPIPKYIWLFSEVLEVKSQINEIRGKHNLQQHLNL